MGRWRSSGDQGGQIMSSADDTEDRTVLLSEEHDPTANDPISMRITRLVAIAADREVIDLEPLGSTIDVDALDGFVNSRSFTDPETTVEVAFTYEGYLVEIEANGRVNIYVEDR